MQLTYTKSLPIVWIDTTGCSCICDKVPMEYKITDLMTNEDDVNTSHPAPLSLFPAPLQVLQGKELTEESVASTSQNRSLAIDEMSTNTSTFVAR